jgi:hypothetical protein
MPQEAADGGWSGVAWLLGHVTAAERLRQAGRDERALYAVHRIAVRQVWRSDLTSCIREVGTHIGDKRTFLLRGYFWSHMMDLNSSMITALVTIRKASCPLSSSDTTAPSLTAASRSVTRQPPSAGGKTAAW